MTERFRRRDFGHMDLQVTIDDPAVYAKPMTLNAGGNLAADTELHRVRLPGERKGSRAPGRAGQPRKRPSRSRRTVLATYVGVYQVTGRPGQLSWPAAARRSSPSRSRRGSC